MKKLVVILLLVLSSALLYKVVRAGNTNPNKDLLSNYKVVVAPDEALLQSRVASSMSQGWQPAGGVSVDQGSFYQAMVK